MQQTTKILSLAVAMFAIVGMMGFSNQVLAVKPGNGAGGVGSGGFQLNLIGMDADDKLTNDGGNNGHRIFVPLDGPTRILLTAGDYAVLDADGTDGVASFQLPDPGNCDDVIFENCTLEYAVWIRVLGQPSDAPYAIVTCATEVNDLNGDGVADEVCSVETVAEPSANGPGKNAKFVNVTRELLTLCIDTNLLVDSNGDGNLTNDCNLRAELFDEKFVNYLWEVDANGHRLAQLRFIPTPVEG